MFECVTIDSGDTPPRQKSEVISTTPVYTQMCVTSDDLELRMTHHGVFSIYPYFCEWLIQKNRELSNSIITAVSITTQYAILQLHVIKTRIVQPNI